MIEIRNVTKVFDNHIAVDDVSLEIANQEFFSLLGSSGSGKTTLLRMLAGFETPTSGQILFDGVDMTHVPPFARPVNMMFQSYALFPNMNVEQNIAFGLKQDHLARPVIKKRVDEMLELVELRGLNKRKIHQLSGGQRQRVALARCLAKRPKVLMLDEPLSALDKKLREQMQFQLVDIQEETGITFVMVTHDQSEAMTMSSRIAIMNNGYIEQVGTPNEVYEFPQNKFTADFIGTTNLFSATVVESECDYTTFDSTECNASLRVNRPIEALAGQELYLAVRPEKMQIIKKNGQATTKDPNSFIGVVEDIAYLGGLSTYHVRLASGRKIKATDFNIERDADHPTWEDEVIVRFDDANLMVLLS